MVSSGIRVGATYTMQIGDLIEIRVVIIFYTRFFRMLGTRDKYYTFCTPECYDAIHEYLDYRKRCGEELKGQVSLIQKAL